MSNIVPFTSSDSGEYYAPMSGSGPVSTITYPTNNSVLVSLNYFQGTSSGTGGGNNSSVDKVEISVKRLTGH